MLRAIARIASVLRFGYAEMLEMPMSDFWEFFEMSEVENA
jgi:hypothetical protein